MRIKLTSSGILILVLISNTAFAQLSGNYTINSGLPASTTGLTSASWAMANIATATAVSGSSYTITGLNPTGASAPAWAICCNSPRQATNAEMVINF